MAQYRAIVDCLVKQDVKLADIKATPSMWRLANEKLSDAFWEMDNNMIAAAEDGTLDAYVKDHKQFVEDWTYIWVYTMATTSKENVLYSILRKLTYHIDNLKKEAEANNDMESLKWFDMYLKDVKSADFTYNPCDDNSEETDVFGHIQTLGDLTKFLLDIPLRIKMCYGI